MPCNKDLHFDIRIWDDLLEITECDAEQILNTTRLKLIPRVDYATFARVLDFVRHITLNELRPSALRAKRIRKLSKAVEDYHTTSLEMHAWRDNPPPMPPNWLQSARDWIEQAERILDKRNPGRKQAAFNTTFYPWSLAAFAMCFGRKPASTLNGPTMRFTNAILWVVSEKIENLSPQTELGMYGRTLSEQELESVLEFWEQPSSEGAKTNLRRALKRPSFAASPSVRSSPTNADLPARKLDYEMRIRELEVMFPVNDH